MDSTLSKLWSRHPVGPQEWGPLLQGFIAFAWLIYAAESWLDLRQHRLFAVRTKPKELTYVQQDEFIKAQKYGADKSRFGFVSSLWGVVKLTLQFWFGYYPLLWSVSGVLMTRLLGLGPEHEVTQSMVLYILDACVETALGLPLQLYRTFVIEQRHGFNKQTLALFISDTIKGLLLNCIIAPPLISLFIHVIAWGGPHFYLYVSALLLVVQLIAVPFYSNVIQPCFNKVEPLADGTLRQSIEKLAASIGFPLHGLYVIDGSKRSAHSNAYFYGFWKSKRIVLYDTLISQSTEPQVLAVLAHELGHWRLNHTVKGLALAQLQLLAMFALFGQMIHRPSLYRDFGFRSGAQPIYIGLIFFQCIYSPVQHVLGWLGNVISRRFEFQADAFAAKLGYGVELQEGLISLQKENKGTMLPDPLYSAYHHSHPPLLQRLRAIDQQISSKKEQ